MVQIKTNMSINTIFAKLYNISIVAVVLMQFVSADIIGFDFGSSYMKATLV